MTNFKRSPFLADGVPVEKAPFLSNRDKEVVKQADKWGYKGVAISVYDPEVDNTDYWANKSRVEFICGEPDPKSKLKGRNGSWPGIWDVAQKMNVGGGCGNSEQYQLTSNHDLAKVSYRKTDGVWYVHGWKDYFTTLWKKDLIENPETSGDHIRNIQVIYDFMWNVAQIRKHISDDVAFDLVYKMTDSAWIELLKEATECVCRKFDELTAFSLENLRELMKQLKTANVAEEYSI